MAHKRKRTTKNILLGHSTFFFPGENILFSRKDIVLNLSNRFFPHQFASPEALVCIDVVGRKNIQISISAASSHTIYEEVEDIHNAEDYSCSVDERMC
jgi:hypothetical protein